jgi:hypothetical protein
MFKSGEFKAFDASLTAAKQIIEIGRGIKVESKLKEGSIVYDRIA